MGDVVLLELEPVEAYHNFKQYQHIVVPEKFEHGPEDRPVWGIIKGIGQACTDPMLKVGQRVVVGKWAGARVPFHGDAYLLVRQEDILAIDHGQS